jgi:hypothetical protein
MGEFTQTTKREKGQAHWSLAQYGNGNTIAVCPFQAADW